MTLPDGKTVPGVAWRTTPFEVAMGISKGLANNTVVAQVNGEVWDLDRPFEGDAELKLLKFDDHDAQQVAFPRYCLFLFVLRRRNGHVQAAKCWGGDSCA